MTESEWFEQLFNRLSHSKFRSSFHLKQKDVDYIQTKGMDTIEKHAIDFIEKKISSSLYTQRWKTNTVQRTPHIYCPTCYWLLLQTMFI